MTCGQVALRAPDPPFPSLCLCLQLGPVWGTSITQVGALVPQDSFFISFLFCDSTQLGLQAAHPISDAAISPHLTALSGPGHSLAQQLFSGA